MSDTEYDFQEVRSDASTTFPSQASSLRKNGHIVINNRPCKIAEMKTSKTGKHGSAKIHFTVIDIFTNKKYEDIFPSTHNVDVPHVSRTENPLLNIDDSGYLSLMLPTGETKDDIKVPGGELGKNIQQDFDDGKELIITVIKAMDEENVISYKEAPKS